VHHYKHKHNNSLYQTRYSLICVKDNQKLRLAVNVKSEHKKYDINTNIKYIDDLQETMNE